jgi:hypothetical protein
MKDIKYIVVDKYGEEVCMEEVFAKILEKIEREKMGESE